MNLLTVTCDRDFEEMLLQAKSIEKFVSPCNHYVFVNNTNFNKEFWTESLKPFYKNHELKIFFTDEYFDFSQYQGWVTQQIWKCFAHDWIKDNYIVLDSKNFFIKPVNLENWKFDGSGYVLSENDDRLKLINYYANEYNINPISEYYSNITPFIFQKDVISAVNEELRKNLIFLKDVKPLYHSEFFLYSLFLKRFNLPFEHLLKDDQDPILGIYVNNYKSCVLKSGPKSIVNNVTKVLDHYNMEVSGIHFSWYQTASMTERDHLNSWLNSLSLSITEIQKKILYCN